MKNSGIRIKNLFNELKEELIPLYGEREAGQLVSILFRHYAGLNRADILVREDEEFPSVVGEKILAAKGQLMNFQPIQYIIGTTTFCGLELNVAPGILIPRPETEELAEIVIAENRHLLLQEFSVLDIGTGSGCLAIALRKNFAYAITDAVDISTDALGIASGNAERNGVSITFRELDILSGEQSGRLPGYHMIVSNPPYVTESERVAMSPNVREFEPATALFVPDDDPLLFYRAIGSFAFGHLIRPGTLYLEINERFGPDVRKLMLGLGFDRVEVIRDLSGRDRFIRAEAKHTMADTSYWMVDKNLP